jgi:hypothetical protein
MINSELWFSKNSKKEANDRENSVSFKIEIIQPKLSINFDIFQIITEHGKIVYGNKMKERTRLTRRSEKGEEIVDLNWSDLDSRNDKDLLLHDISHIFITSYLENIGIKPIRMASILNEFMTIIFNQYCWERIENAETFSNNLIEKTINSISRDYLNFSIPNPVDRDAFFKKQAEEQDLNEQELTGNKYSDTIMNYFVNNNSESEDIINNIKELKNQVKKLALIILDEDEEILETWSTIQTQVLNDNTNDGHLAVEKNDKQIELFSKIKEIVDTLEIINDEQSWGLVFDEELIQNEESIYSKLNKNVKNFYSNEQNNTNNFSELELDDKIEWLKKFINKTYDVNKIMLLKSQALFFVAKYNEIESLNSSFSMEYELRKDYDDTSLIQLRKPVVEKINRIISNLPAWANLL